MTDSMNPQCLHNCLWWGMKSSIFSCLGSSVYACVCVHCLSTYIDSCIFYWVIFKLICKGSLYINVNNISSTSNPVASVFNTSFVLVLFMVTLFRWSNKCLFWLWVLSTEGQSLCFGESARRPRKRWATWGESRRWHEVPSPLLSGLQCSCLWTYHSAKGRGSLDKVIPPSHFAPPN